MGRNTPCLYCSRMWDDIGNRGGVDGLVAVDPFWPVDDLLDPRLRKQLSSVVRAALSSARLDTELVLAMNAFAACAQRWRPRWRRLDASRV
jgi:hypothetical protein